MQGIGYYDTSTSELESINVLESFEDAPGTSYGDTNGGLDQLFPPAGCTAPDGDYLGIVGQCATFEPTSSQALAAKDLRVGATALPRDLTVSAILAWDVASQQSAGTSGTLIARGKGNASIEYMPFAVELYIVDYATKLAGVRFLWNTAAGALKTETGGTFTAPTDLSFFMLTCTRRWISPTSVVLRYYFNDQLLAEVASADGDIAASADGTTSIGARYTGAAYANFIAAAIDELAIMNYEMCAEEIAAIWQRIHVEQPDGYRLIKDMMPPGIPISDDPASRAQADLQSIGVGLGFAAGQIENMRNNLMPDRAYGDVLRSWEKVTREPAKPGDALDTRRTRVGGHIGSRMGVSVPGVQTALAQVLDDEAASGANIAVYAFDNTIRDAFATLNTLRWMPNLAADWSVTGGALRVQPPPSQLYPWDQTAPAIGESCLIPIEAARAAIGNTPRTQVSIAASLMPTVLPRGSEAGIVLANWAQGHMLFVGVRNTAGAYTIGYQRFAYNVASDATWQVLHALGGAVESWLRVRPYSGFFAGTTDQQAYDLSYATAAPTSEASYTTLANQIWQRDVGWAGFYFRTFNTDYTTFGTVADCRFAGADFALRNTLGTRPFGWYGYRDPGLGGSPDYVGADRIVQRMKHAFTTARVVSNLIAKCDDPASLCDLTPMGAL